MQQGSPPPVRNLGSNLWMGPTEGTLSWAIPTKGLSPKTNYQMRATKVSPSLTDTSNATFTITAPVHNYYVNDNSTAGDQYTTAVGDDANSGLDAAHPKASIRSLLLAYSLGAGGTIYADTGVYTLSSNTVISTATN